MCWHGLSGRATQSRARFHANTCIDVVATDVNVLCENLGGDTTFDLTGDGIVGVAMHRQAVDAATVDGGVVIEEADDVVAATLQEVAPGDGC